jgi:hypothetical protein
VDGITFSHVGDKAITSNKNNKTYDQMLEELEGLDLQKEGAEKIHVQVWA